MTRSGQNKQMGQKRENSVSRMTSLLKLPVDPQSMGE
jgi:hypothetical protein